MSEFQTSRTIHHLPSFRATIVKYLPASISLPDLSVTAKVLVSPPRSRDPPAPLARASSRRPVG